MRLAIYMILAVSVIFFQCKKNAEVNNGYVQDPGYSNQYPPGNSAKDFLRSSIYKSLIIEVQYMPGLKPNTASVEILVKALNERLNKPLGIFVVYKEINPTLQSNFSIDDISDIESLNRTMKTGADQLSAYIVLVDGSYYDGGILAMAYRNTSLCVFGEPLKYFSGGLIEDAKTKVLAILFMHEFGHLLGLVNMGTRMTINHEDGEGASHCTNSACLMHHTFNSNSRVVFNVDIQVPYFDNNCINDLRANGGK
jgi:hypothetical protein